MLSSHDVRSDGRDLGLVSRLNALYVAVLSDCLDKIGLRDHVMVPRTRPPAPGSRTAGFAATVRAVAVDRPPDDPEDWYAGEIRAVDSQQPGDVMVSTSPGSYRGDLLATAGRWASSPTHTRAIPPP